MLNLSAISNSFTTQVTQAYNYIQTNEGKAKIIDIAIKTLYFIGITITSAYGIFAISASVYIFSISNTQGEAICMAAREYLNIDNKSFLSLFPLIFIGISTPPLGLFFGLISLFISGLLIVSFLEYLNIFEN